LISKSFDHADALPAGIICYVKASAAASGADGSIEKPFPSLEDAIDDKIATGKTADVIFEIAAGAYTCSKTITQNTAQHVSFRGEGAGKTIIQASATFGGGMDADILKLVSYGDLEFQDITFRNCRYAVRPTCAKLCVERCEFLRCGSSGDSDQHDNSLSQANQALRYTDASLQKMSNGGALRCDGASGAIRIVQNQVKHCLRGLRVTNAVAGGLIEGNFCRDTVESGIYLNAGCADILIQNNKCLDNANNGILLVSTRFCQVLNNAIDESWNTAIMCWHCSELTVKGNSIRDCG